MIIRKIVVLILLIGLGAVPLQAQRKKYKKQRNLRVLDYSNISGSKSLQFSVGTVASNIDKPSFSTGSIHLGKINNGKALIYSGVRYLTDKQEEYHNSWYLAEIGYSPYLFTFARFIDFRTECSIVMGVANKEDYRTGHDNTFYALGVHPGASLIFKLNTYFYISTKLTLISIYDTKVVDTYPLGGLSIFVNL